MVEGTKSVLELLNSTYEVSQVYATGSFLNENGETLQMLADLVVECSEPELAKLSGLQTNQSVLAIAKIPKDQTLQVDPRKYYLALDRIRDPGNLGTILRIADWYGVEHVLCSADCADLYNPKVIQATMGSFTRVQTYYLDLASWLDQFEEVYAAVLDGENVHHASLTKPGVLVIGNESQGIAAELMSKVTRKLTIPAFGGAESLNAAVATAILCDNLKRGAGSNP